MIVFAVVSTVATPLLTSSATKVFCGGASTVTVIVPEVYPVPAFKISTVCITPPSPNVATAVAAPVLNPTSGATVYPEPVFVNTNLLIEPVVSIVALTVAF